MKYLLITLLFFSCTKESYLPMKNRPIDLVLKEEPSQNRSFDNITYYANQHISNHGYITYPMNQWDKTVVFTSSCRYITDDPLNQDDWNKLFGIRKNATNNYKNGAYLVWCYIPQVTTPDGILYDKIRIGWYLHDDDEDFVLMPLSETIYVDLNTPVYLYLRNYNNTFVYNLDGVTVNINKSQYDIDNFSNGWRLSPNFGGQETPDHNVTITYNN